jgi:hypothetical protein
VCNSKGTTNFAEELLGAEVNDILILIANCRAGRGSIAEFPERDQAHALSLQFAAIKVLNLAGTLKSG